MTGTLRWNAHRGQWQVDITIKGRRLRPLAGTSRTVANAVLDEYRRRRLLAHHGLPVWIGGDSPSLETFAETYKARLRSRNLSPRTIEIRENLLRLHVNPGLGHVPLSLLDERTVQTYLDQRRKDGAANGALCGELDLIRNLLGVAKKDGVIAEIPELPRRPKPAPRRDRVLSAEEASQLVAAVQGDEGLERFTWIALWTGLRISEILRIRWREVDFDTRLLFIPVTKTGKELYVHIAEPLRAYLWERRGKPGKPVIEPDNPDPRKEALHMGKQLTRRARKAGLESVSPHTLRHSVGSHVAARKGVVVARDTLGHASVSMTDRYLHALPKVQQEALEGLPWSTEWQQTFPHGV